MASLLPRSFLDVLLVRHPASADSRHHLPVLLLPPSVVQYTSSNLLPTDHENCAMSTESPLVNKNMASPSEDAKDDIPESDHNGKEKGKREEDEEDLFENADEDPIKSNDEPQEVSHDTNEIETEPNLLPTENEAAGNVESKDEPNEEAPLSPPTHKLTKEVTSIPRKERPSMAPPPVSSIKAASNEFGLPQSVRIPPSVTASILNGKLLETVKTLPPNLISDAFQEYDDALQVKGHSIRNRGGYLYGVIKRYISVHDRAKSGESGILPMGERITPDVERRLEDLVASGFCTREEMTDKVKSKIRMLSERDAFSALDELTGVDRTSIRNFGSYFMGILNRYMRGPEDAKQQRGREYRSSSSSSHYGRDRSRDRYETAPPPRGQQLSMQYDMRHQPPPWQQPDRSRQPPSNATYLPSSPQQPSMYSQLPQQQFVSQGFQQQQQQPPMHQQPYYGNQQQPPPYGNQPYNMNQPPAYNQNQPPPYDAGPQRSYNAGPATFMQQSNLNQPYIMNQQQQPSPYMNQPQQSLGSSALLGQQQQFQPSSGSNAGGALGTYAAPAAGGGWQQQSQPLDILGLADKAASAVQALTNQNKGPGAFQAQPSAQFGAAQALPTYGQPPSMAMKQGSLPGQLPYQQTLGPSYAPHSSGGPGWQDPQQQAGQARRTSASLEQLPIMVQYAVQNLQNTGAVEQPLDGGMLRMIYDLPEPMALAALNKFASLDKTAMRNKTAYLAGLLRRELQLINRR